MVGLDVRTPAADHCQLWFRLGCCNPIARISFCVLTCTLNFHPIAIGFGLGTGQAHQQKLTFGNAKR